MHVTYVRIFEKKKLTCFYTCGINRHFITQWRMLECYKTVISQLLQAGCSLQVHLSHHFDPIFVPNTFIKKQ